CAVALRAVDSFPTRRSSDLTSRAAPHHPRRVGPSVPGGGGRRTRRARSRSCGRAVWAWNPPLVSYASNGPSRNRQAKDVVGPPRSEEHTSELQSRGHLVCRL